MQENIKTIKEQLDRIEQYALLSAKNVLTMNDAVILTGLSKARLYTLTSTREIPHYKQGKVYFKRVELEQWMTSHRVRTNAEARSEAIIRGLNK